MPAAPAGRRRGRARPSPARPTSSPRWTRRPSELIRDAHPRRPARRRLPRRGGRRRASAPAASRWVVDPIDGTVNFLYGIPTTPSRSPPQRRRGRGRRRRQHRVRRRGASRSRRRGLALDGDGDRSWLPRRGRTSVAQALVGDRVQLRPRDPRAPRPPRSAAAPAGPRHPPDRLGRARPVRARRRAPRRLSRAGPASRGTSPQAA